jgi:hypothetical protein
VKFGVLSTVLLLATIMLTTIDVNQNPVFAQNITTPHLPAQDSTSTPTTSALEPSGSDDTTSNDGDDSDSQQDTTSNDGDDSDSQQDTTSNDGDDSDSQTLEDEETEDEYEQTNPLRDQIRNNVNGALSASGIAVS